MQQQQQHPGETYDHRVDHSGTMQQMSPTQPHHHDQQQNSYLSSSPLVQQPLPASAMAPSVAALQRLSASIDVTISSRSNSRASAYEDNSNKSEKSEIREDIIEAAAEARPPQYLTANCVVYTFYSGDLTSAIDDHFNRALKRANNNSTGSSPEQQHSESAKSGN